MAQNENLVMELEENKENGEQHQESETEESKGRESPEPCSYCEELAKLEDGGEDGQAAIEQLLARAGTDLISYLDDDELEEFAEEFQEEEIGEGNIDENENELDDLIVEYETSEEDKPTLP